MANALQEQLDKTIEVIHEAEGAIMKLYNAKKAKKLKIRQKPDGTPVTKADIAAHRILTKGLGELFDIPILSEEGDKEENREIAASDRFIALDPIDNTRGMIAHAGQFMTGIALVENGTPTYGIAYALGEGDMYFGGPGLGSFKHQHGTEPEQMRVSGEPTGVMMVSPFQGGAGMTAMFLEQNYNGYLRQPAESYMRYIGVAEGIADIYARASTGMQVWDCAPGHALVTGAGGSVTYIGGQEIDYRSSELELLVNGFIASRETSPFRTDQ